MLKIAASVVICVNCFTVGNDNHSQVLVLSLQLMNSKRIKPELKTNCNSSPTNSIF